MPEKNVPTHDDYADDHVVLRVDHHRPDGLVRVHAAGVGAGASIALSVLGAQRLSAMLAAAVTAVVARDPGR